jgi:hypothetical protein
VRRRTPEDRYKYNIRKQQKTLEDYAAHEVEWAEDLLHWYKIRKEEMPEDEYRAAAFFLNKEFSKKPGSLTLLYQMYLRCLNELPGATQELAFDLLSYRFKMYAAVLNAGGYNGREDW